MLVPSDDLFDQVTFPLFAIPCHRGHVHRVEFTGLAHEELGVYALIHERLIIWLLRLMKPLIALTPTHVRHTQTCALLVR